MGSVLPIDRKQGLLARIEVAYVAHEVVLYTDVMQRLYGRLFDVMQLNLYSLSRSAAGRAEIKELDAEVRRLLDDLLAHVGGLALEPPAAGAQRTVAKVVSPIARKYLRCLVLLDRIVAGSSPAERQDTVRLIRRARGFASRCAEAAFRHNGARSTTA